jgi:hypothetical protein
VVARGASWPPTNARGPASRSYWLPSAGAGVTGAVLGGDKRLTPRGVTVAGATGGDTTGAADGGDVFPEELLVAGGVASSADAVTGADRDGNSVRVVVTVRVEAVPAATPVTVTRPLPLMVTEPFAVAVPAQVKLAS